MQEGQEFKFILSYTDNLMPALATSYHVSTKMKHGGKRAEGEFKERGRGRRNRRQGQEKGMGRREGRE